MKKLALKQKMCQEGLASNESLEQSVQSYLGVLRHCRGYEVAREIGKVISCG